MLRRVGNTYPPCRDRSDELDLSNAGNAYPVAARLRRVSDLKPTRSETYKWIAYSLAAFGVIVLSVTFMIYRKQFAGNYAPSGSARARDKWKGTP